LPVWVGGGSQLAHPGSVEKPRLDARVGRRIARSDGWFSRPTAQPDQIADDWRELQSYLAEAGREPGDLVVAHGQWVHLTEEVDHARAVTLQHAVAEDILGQGRSREQLEQSYLFGTLDEIVEACRRRAAVGVAHLILHPYTDDPSQVELWGRELLPRLTQLDVVPLK
ncbi:MAG: hypothetical protein ACYDAG_17820, partial [Chloroflexota bacterium]